MSKKLKRLPFNWGLQSYYLEAAPLQACHTGNATMYVDVMVSFENNGV